VAVVGLLDRLSRRAHEPRLDAELAQAQALVGVEGDLRAADQRELLAAGVLEQVGGELVDDLLLHPFEALAILRAQPHDVLVGHVGARHGDGLVLVHLARQLARDLDGADLGAEDAAERPLDEAGDLVLEVAQEAHQGRGSARRHGPPARSPVGMR
jgi:hypothetical protein